MSEFSPEVTDPLDTQPSGRTDEQSMLGRHVGPYRIEREIGHGGMGTCMKPGAPTENFSIASPSS
jgi:hypothetical protein